MIRDRPGTIQESTFGLEAPLLFLNETVKINNPNCKKIGHVPIEEQVPSLIEDVTSSGAQLLLAVFGLGGQ